jgi:hypothetical protein
MGRAGDLRDEIMPLARTTCRDQRIHDLVALAGECTAAGVHPTIWEGSDVPLYVFVSYVAIDTSQIEGITHGHHCILLQDMLRQDTGSALLSSPPMCTLKCQCELFASETWNVSTDPSVI